MDAQQPAYKDIAPRLRGLRDAMDMTVEDMADQVGASADDRPQLRVGEHEIPVSYLFNVAQAFQVDLTVLMSGKEAHLHTLPGQERQGHERRAPQGLRLQEPRLPFRRPQDGAFHRHGPSQG
jgi:transcriptional regulator with XRE-family HTH domain